MEHNMDDISTITVVLHCFAFAYLGAALTLLFMGFLDRNYRETPWPRFAFFHALALPYLLIRNEGDRSPLWPPRPTSN
jgi:hypothetical protein